MRNFLILLVLLPILSHAQIQVSSQIKNEKQHFAIVKGAATANILYDASDDILIQKSAAFLAGDIEKVTGKKPSILTSKDQANDNLILTRCYIHFIQVVQYFNWVVYQLVKSRFMTFRKFVKDVFTFFKQLIVLF